MKAVCWDGRGQISVKLVPDPAILNPRDAIIKVRASAICGSDLHLYNGYIPGMRKGDILGHEAVGEVVELGACCESLRRGDRVVVPFAIACGRCVFCQSRQWSLCDNSNPNAGVLEALYGFSGAGLFGYSHLYGGYAGGQAEYLRVPFADVGPLKVPPELSDEEVLFLSDILPTGYMAAERCAVQPGDTIAVWGCGPVGLMALLCARLLGAERLIAIDRYSNRLALAAEHTAAIPLNYEQTRDVVGALTHLTGGRGPDACIDAVGMEAHAPGPLGLYERTKQAIRLQPDRPHVLRQAIQACRKGGTVSIPGVYGGFIDQAPFGAAFAKGLTIRMGQTPVHQYMPRLLERIRNKELDPTFIITHRMHLEEAPEAYRMFRDKDDGCVKVVLYPNGHNGAVRQERGMPG